MESGNHIIIEPGTGACQNAAVEIEQPGCCKPTITPCGPTIEPNPSPEETEPDKMFCNCPPQRPVNPCPPPDMPSSCPQKPNLGNNPCCDEDPRFIMKRLILLEREVKKLTDFIGSVLGDDGMTLQERLDNFAKNICEANKLIQSDISGLDRRMNVMEELGKEIEKIPTIQADIVELQTCCQQSREFIDKTTENFTKAYEQMNEISNELKDDINGLDIRVSNAEEAITGVDGFNQALSMLDQKLMNAGKTLDTKIANVQKSLQFNIDELAATVEDIATIRNNVNYIKNYSKEVGVWIDKANEKFTKIDKDIETLTKEVEKLQ